MSIDVHIHMYSDRVFQHVIAFTEKDDNPKANNYEQLWTVRNQYSYNRVQQLNDKFKSNSPVNKINVMKPLKTDLLWATRLLIDGMYFFLFYYWVQHQNSW